MDPRAGIIPRSAAAAFAVILVAACSLPSDAPAASGVMVAPLEGTGTLELSVLWNPGDVDVPSVQASLTSAFGPELELPFVISGAQAKYSGSNLPSGSSALVLRLFDDGREVMDAVDVVRIAAGQRTSGSYGLQKGKKKGVVQVSVNPDMRDPLTVSMTGASGTLARGDATTVSASVSNFGSNVIFVWYLNGTSVRTGPSFTMGPGLAPGGYRVDVTALSTDGARAGSATAAVQVVP